MVPAGREGLDTHENALATALDMDRVGVRKDALVLDQRIERGLKVRAARGEIFENLNIASAKWRAAASPSAKSRLAAAAAK